MNINRMNVIKSAIASIVKLGDVADTFVNVLASTISIITTKRDVDA